MKAKTTKEVLIAMRWIIDNVGWCQNALYKDCKGASVFVRLNEMQNIASVCLVGAHELVEKEGYNQFAFGLLYNLTDGFPAGWNNKPGRTKEEVLALLDEAIAKA